MCILTTKNFFSTLQVLVIGIFIEISLFNAILITMLVVFLLIVGWSFYQCICVHMLQVWTNGPKCMPSW